MDPIASKQNEDTQIGVELREAVGLPVDVSFAYKPELGWDLGGGVAWPSGRLLARSVVRGLKTEIKKFPPNASTHTRSVTTFNQYKQLMSNLTQATGSGFGVSASATVKYVSEKEYNDLTMFLVTGHTVTNAVEMQPYDRWDDLALSDEALTVLQRSAGEFVRRYGTHFVSGFVHGGSFLGCVDIRTRSESEKTQLQIDMKASISAFGANGDIANSYKNDIAKLRIECQKSADSFIQGGLPRRYPADDIKKMVEARDDHWDTLASAEATTQMLALCTQYRALKQVQALREGRLLQKDKQSGEWTETRLPQDKIPADIELLWQDCTDMVLDLLTLEYEALKYMKSIAAAALANKRYIGPSKKQDLEAIEWAARSGLDQLENLPFEKFSELTLDKIEDSGLLVSKQWLPRLETAATAGRLTLEWTITVPHEYSMSGGQFRVALSNLDAQGKIDQRQEGAYDVYVGRKDIKLNDGSFRLASSVFQVIIPPFIRGWSNQGGWNYFVDVVGTDGLRATIDHQHHKVYKSAVLRGEDLREGKAIELRTDAFRSGHPTIACLSLKAI